jgi:hypothetical protein
VVLFMQFETAEVPCPHCGGTLPATIEAPPVDAPQAPARKRGRFDPLAGWGVSLLVHALILLLLIQITWLVGLSPGTREQEVGIVDAERATPIETLRPVSLSTPTVERAPLESLMPASVLPPQPMDLPQVETTPAAAVAPRMEAAVGAGLGGGAETMAGPDAFINLGPGLTVGPGVSAIPAGRGTGVPGLGLGGGGLQVTDPLPLKRMYGLRTAAGRARIIGKLGGSPATETAVQRALVWFARHQSDDGRWDCDAFMNNYAEKGLRCDGAGGARSEDVGVTALATLCFLGAGHTHLAAYQDDKGSHYNECVRKAITWLVTNQKDDGDLRQSGTMYSHGMATTALAEAYAMTEDQTLAEPMRKAAEFIVNAQRPDSGWRYQPRSDSDTSVVGWNVMGLKSAHVAGFTEPPTVFRGAANWLDHVRYGKVGGLYGYTGPSGTPAMTAEGLFVDQYIEFNPNTPRVQESIRYILDNKPHRWEDRGRGNNLYFWYYATLALHQIGGQGWNEWNKAMQAVLPEAQRLDGPFFGSWDTNTAWGSRGGRVYTTALATLILEVYYRYLPFNMLQMNEPKKR